MRKKLFAAVAVALIAILCAGCIDYTFADFKDAVLGGTQSTIFGLLPSSEEQSATTEQSELTDELTVVRVVDGDTAIIKINNQDTYVRFIGIDTPESVNPDETKNTPQGKIASEYTKALLTGKTVRLEYDVERQDTYGRTLAYVWLDGELVNLKIIRDGYATQLTIPPNVKYAEQFAEAYQQARDEGIGLWQEQ